MQNNLIFMILYRLRRLLKINILIALSLANFIDKPPMYLFLNNLYCNVFDVSCGRLPHYCGTQLRPPFLCWCGLAWFGSKLFIFRRQNSNKKPHYKYADQLKCYAVQSCFKSRWQTSVFDATVRVFVDSVNTLKWSRSPVANKTWQRHEETNFVNVLA